jgi:hypothetical protein
MKYKKLLIALLIIYITIALVRIGSQTLNVFGCIGQSDFENGINNDSPRSEQIEIIKNKNRQSCADANYKLDRVFDFTKRIKS